MFRILYSFLNLLNFERVFQHVKRILPHFHNFKRILQFVQPVKHLLQPFQHLTTHGSTFSTFRTPFQHFHHYVTPIMLPIYILPLLCDASDFTRLMLPILL